MADPTGVDGTGIRIYPGQWRPEYPAEHIAWVCPPWTGDGYVWLDFPEAVFCAGELLFLSHLSAAFKQAYPLVPHVPWPDTAGGIAFSRTLPNGVGFSGALTRKDAGTVAMELHLVNGSDRTLTDVRLQTCAYLRAIKEFADYTNENKLVHVVDAGWTPLAQAMELQEERGSYRIGWRAGRQAADLPVMVTLSNQAERLVAMTWGQCTYSLVGNPNHPCMHADPYCEDLAPGTCATIHGELIFFQGTLDEFEAWWRARQDTA